MFDWDSAWMRLHETKWKESLLKRSEKKGEHGRGRGESSTIRGKSDREAAWTRQRKIKKRVKVKPFSTSEERR